VAVHREAPAVGARHVVRGDAHDVRRLPAHPVHAGLHHRPLRARLDDDRGADQGRRAPARDRPSRSRPVREVHLGDRPARELRPLVDGRLDRPVAARRAPGDDLDPPRRGRRLAPARDPVRGAVGAARADRRRSRDPLLRDLRDRLASAPARSRADELLRGIPPRPALRQLLPFPAGGATGSAAGHAAAGFRAAVRRAARLGPAPRPAVADVRALLPPPVHADDPGPAPRDARRAVRRGRAGVASRSSACFAHTCSGLR